MIFKKRTIIISLALLLIPNLFSNEINNKNSKTNYTPVGVYWSDITDNLKTYSYGGSFLVNHINDLEDIDLINPDGFSVMAGYYQELDEYYGSDESNLFHTINFNSDVRFNRNKIAIAFNSANKEPFSTLSGTSGYITYGREFFDNKKLSLIIGGGLFMSKMELGDITLPVIPLPICSFTYNTDDYFVSLEFTGGLNLNFLLFNQNSFRIRGSLWTNGLRSFRDICGDISLRYYPLKDHELLQVMNFMVGIANNAVQFGMPNDDLYEYQNYTIYGGFDMAALTIKAGYDFSGIQMLNSEKKNENGKGWFINVNALWQF